MDEMGVPAAARSALLRWFDATGRELPFRDTGDPYAILVSEVMAQQTQIARASQGWVAFLATFPTVEHLAAAAPADVLRAWRGLGYNRRALNLQRAARVVVVEHGGRVPSDLGALERLPGVGPYTARAVALFAHRRPVGPVDTNVRRVLVRLRGESTPIPPRRMQAIADASVPRRRPAAWTHALMDLGATVCRPARPRCAECPLRRWCRFAASGGARPAPARRRAPEPSFRSTSRWLRGRILEALRDAPAGAWTEIVGPLGEHGDEAVGAALGAMAREGLVERDADRPMHARLPMA